MALRDYQADMVQRTRQAFRKHRRVLLQAPTGAGKTHIAVHIMQAAADSGKRSMFVVHQRELLMQTSRAMWDAKLPHGLIVPGKKQLDMPIQLASVMTLKNRLARYTPPGLIIFDESHRALAGSYLDVLNAYPDARVLGLTATPQRTDGRGLGHVYSEIVDGPSIRHLIEAGHLCDYDLYGLPVNLDVSNIKTTRGDFDAAELEAATNRREITGDAVEHYRKHALGRSCVVMCVSVQHAEAVAAEYTARGIPARAVHGQSPDRDTIMADFRARKFDVLCSVQLLVEGVDVPHISCIQWLRPTQSLVVYMQGIGRGLRPHPDKDKLTILDHVGNYLRHGLPDEHRDWNLEDRERGAAKKSPTEDDAGVQVCEACFMAFRTGVRECPHCGGAVPFKQRPEIQQVEGELQRIAEAAMLEQHRLQTRREQGTARSLEDLIRIGIRRGMKNPQGWAVNIVAAREHRRPSSADWAAARAVRV